MAEYNIPQNRPNWVLADFVLAPSIYMIVWILLVKYESFNIYQYLLQQPYLLQKIKADAVSGFAAHRWIDLYILGYKGIIAGVIGFVGMLVSFNENVPGIGRQLFIPFRKWQINKIERTKGMKKLDQHENPLFPPTVSRVDPVYLQGARDPTAQPGVGILMGLRKRFRQEIEKDKRNRVKTEKLSDYFPLILSVKSRFRHILCVGGSGSGKTASVVGPLMRGDITASRSSVFCLNPKGDEYLLRVAADPVLRRREHPIFQKLEHDFQVAVREGETRSFARWAIEERKTSTKPFALISLSHPDVSLLYNPLEYGDADQITKKLIYSSDAIGGNEFYKSQQETWLQSFMLLQLSDDDLKGRMGLQHIHWFSMNPKKRIGEALSPVVDVDAEVKFPHLADKIRRQREYERLMNSSEKEEAEKVKERGLLSEKEKDMLLIHDGNRNRLRNLMEMPADHLGGLSGHVSQLVEDSSISGIFTDSNRPSLDFREVMRCGGVLYIEVPTQSKAPQARAIARMLMMELQSYSADRDRGVEPKTCPVFAFIDEFGSLVYDEFINCIDKARSSEISFCLAHQSLGNLEKKHLSSSFRKEIFDNCATKFILGIQDVETQSYFKSVLGEEEVLRRSVSEADSTSTGQKSGRTRGVNRGFQEAREFVVTEAELACKRGFGFARILEDDQSSWRGAISLGYLPEEKLRSFADCMNFLEKERMNHPRRGVPFYTIAQDGQLWDPLMSEVVRAGAAHRPKKREQGADGPEDEPLPEKTNDSTGGGANAGGDSTNPRDFFLGG